MTHIFGDLARLNTYVSNFRVLKILGVFENSSGKFLIFGIRILLIKKKVGGFASLSWRSNIRNLLPSAKQLYNIRVSSTNHSLVETHPTVDLKLFEKIFINKN